MKKSLGILVVAAIAVATAWNFNQGKNEVEASDLTLDNLEAIAQGRGIFPACQKTKLTSGTKKQSLFASMGNANKWNKFHIN